MKEDLQKQQWRINDLINTLDKSRKLIEKLGIPPDIINLIKEDNLTMFHTYDGLGICKYRIDIEIPIDKLRDNE